MPAGAPEPSRPRALVLATRNRGKVLELRALLAGLPVVVRALDAYPGAPVLPEPAETFAENARSKAVAAARFTGEVAVADDSGLEVDALDGAPGAHSATILGPTATDEDRYRWVLDRLRGVEEGRRAARFRAVVAVATPDGDVETFEGVCEGRIADRPRGEHGFGYDPILFLPAYGRTMAELPPAVKNAISHRGRALEAARVHLRWLVGGVARKEEPGAATK